jgi:hypothetical protein
MNKINRSAKRAFCFVLGFLILTTLITGLFAFATMDNRYIGFLITLISMFFFIFFIDYTT